MKRVVRLHAVAFDRGVKFLEPARRADKCAAGPESGNEVGDPAIRLLPNLQSRCLVVRLPVGVVVVLVGVEVLVGLSGYDFADRTLAPSVPSVGSVRTSSAP